MGQFFVAFSKYLNSKSCFNHRFNESCKLLILFTSVWITNKENLDNLKYIFWRNVSFLFQCAEHLSRILQNNLKHKPCLVHNDISLKMFVSLGKEKHLLGLGRLFLTLVDLANLQQVLLTKEFCIGIGQTLEEFSTR